MEFGRGVIVVDSTQQGHPTRREGIVGPVVEDRSVDRERQMVAVATHNDVVGYVPLVG